MKKIFGYIFCFFTLIVFSQNEKVIKHTVSKGETVNSIALKHKTTPYKIFILNPEAKQGINEGDTLLITVDISDTTTSSAATTHKVAAKETLFSIAKQYNITINDLQQWNEGLLEKGLQEGQILQIKAPKAIEPVTKNEDAKPNNDTFHIVQAKETKFGIAQQYALTVAQLEELNPEIKDGLLIGIKLKIKPSTQNLEKNTSEKYIVKPQETLFSLCDSLQIEQSELIKLNPELSNGLKAGMVLQLPQSSQKETIIQKTDTVKSQPIAKKKAVLQHTVQKKSARNLALFLPFNLSRIANDTLKSKQEYLKKDKFLNITLDFYAGALMAIDSARTLGLPLKVNIFDCESNKYESNIPNLIKANDFTKFDAVIGPFQSIHALETAQLLNPYNIPVISPLSNEEVTGTPNLYQAMPSSNYQKSYLINYFLDKKANVIAILHSKKQGTRNFITQNYPEVKIVALTDKGGISTESFQNLLLPNQMNYVLLDAETVGMISSAISLTTGKKNVQLAVFDGKNETFDFENIYKKIVASQIMYPSVTRNNTSREARIFEKKFKKQNNIFPNEFATRGFDITFDTILRIFQPEGFIQSAATTTSEQVESQFEYQTSNGRNYNTGVYIQQIKSDFTIETLTP